MINMGSDLQHQSSCEYFLMHLDTVTKYGKSRVLGYLLIHLASKVNAEYVI